MRSIACLHGAKRCHLLHATDGNWNHRPLATDNVELDAEPREHQFGRAQVGAQRGAHPSAGSGVRMSLNMMTPSGRKARQGCATKKPPAERAHATHAKGHAPATTALWRCPASQSACETDTYPSTCSALVSALRELACLSQAHSRNAAMYRPACRMSHTGGRSAAEKHSVSAGLPCGATSKRTLAPRHTQQKRVASCGMRRVRRAHAAPRARPRWARNKRRWRHKPHARHHGGGAAGRSAAVDGVRQAWAERRRAGAQGGGSAWSCWHFRVVRKVAFTHDARYRRAHALRKRDALDSRRLSQNRAWRTARGALLSVSGQACNTPAAGRSSQGAVAAARVRGFEVSKATHRTKYCTTG